jgi:hypothetical protein
MIGALIMKVVVVLERICKAMDTKNTYRSTEIPTGLFLPLTLETINLHYKAEDDSEWKALIRFGEMDSYRHFSPFLSTWKTVNDILAHCNYNWGFIYAKLESQLESLCEGGTGTPFK